MIIYEGKINTEDRNKLPDSAFGIPSKRKYPLTDKDGKLDKDHILQAVRFFNKADEADKPILAKNIIAAAKKLDMDYSKWETVLKYAKEEAIKEAFSNDKWNLGWYRPVSLKCIETMRNKHVRWDYGQGLNDIYPNIDSSCRGTIFVDEQMTPVAYYVIRENIFGESYLLASAVCKNFQDHGVEEQLKYLINEYMNEDWTIEDAKKIASRIHGKVQADSKPPTGNQNCQLCTWCAEANFRGIDVLPRPIYSPRDPALEIVGETIIKNPVRKSLKSGFDDWLDLLAESGPKARWYCHVNWKGSEGGHEFLILVDGDKKWIMDPQQGFVEKFLETSSYVSDVNYDNSYICRLDDGEFNKELFDKWNDESTIVPWDPALDIPYMKENGMLSDEDLNTLESKDVFTSGDFAKYGDGVDLNAARGPIQQEAVHTDKDEKIPVKDKSFDKLYFGSPKKYGNCIELNGPLFVSPYIGIASIFIWRDMEIQKHVPKGSYNLQYEEWMHASEEELNKPFKDVHVYVEGYPELEPYEIENTGYIHVIDGHDYGDKLCRYKWMAEDLEYLIDDTAAQNEVHVTKVIECTVRYHISGKATNNPKLGPYKNTAVQEGAWGDIRNGVNPWSKKKVFHISPQGHLDGQVFKPRVPEYLDKYDPSLPDFEDVSTPRICFSPSIEGCLNAILVNIGRWKTADKLRDWYVYVPEKPLNAYKYRTSKQLIKEKKVYDANLTKEIWIEEPVRLKQYGIIRIDSVSDKTRKNAVPSTKGESKRRNVYNFKWHWLVKPKVLKDVAYDYSPMGVCKDMADELYGFKWGLAENGSVRNASPQEFDTKYHLQSPEEFEKNHGGICYDFVEWEAGYLEAYGYTCRKFYISTETPGHDTHTFILVDDGKGGFIYPEGAFKLMEGVYEVKSPEEAALKIMDKMFDVSDANKKLKEIKYYVWEYKDHPPYGSDMETCQKYFTQHDPFHEGTATKIK